MEKRFETEIKIARMLASQYYWAANSPNDLVNKLTLREYYNKSLQNWISAARGVISLIKNREKENFSDGGGI